MITVGVTGGIASGKTHICKIMKKLGAYLIEGDKIGHSVLEMDDVIAELTECFGEDVLNDDRKIDRAKLGDMVFSSKELLKKLNSITHPRIQEIIREKINRLDESGYPGVVIIDAAVLGDWELIGQLDQIIFVDSPQWHRVKRLMEERKYDQKEAERRIKALGDIQEKVSPYITLVIKNTGEPDELRAKVSQLWLKINSEK